MLESRPNSIAAALAGGANQPHAAFDALCDLSRRTVGHRLFTLMIFDDVTGEASRIYSNMPDAYPVSGKKPANESHWSRRVIEGRDTFVANDIEAIAEVFTDYELIRSLGCEAVINVPVFVAGRFLGTINCLDGAGHYTPERVAASETLKLPGAACFLMQKFLEDGGR
ncbi:MAG: GAF domain-containing protein [Rhizobiaceae bacterium]